MWKYAPTVSLMLLCCEPSRADPSIGKGAGGGAGNAQAPTMLISASATAQKSTSSGADTGLPEMLRVPGGKFTMGANDEGEMDERPAHQVTVASFWFDTTEVTNAAYLECVHAGICAMYASLEGSPLTHGNASAFHLPDHPVAGVSWFDAKKYCGWRGKRLPREAEWERAARGDDNRRYVWGNETPNPAKHGAFGGLSSTVAVGAYPQGKGAYGHLDLAGNVWEWMADDYDPYAYRRRTADRGIPGSCGEIISAQNELRKQGKQGFTGSNPIPTQCERVLRGGAYNYRAEGLRNSNRVHHPPSFRIAVAGFRCAKDDDGAAHPKGP